MNLLKLVDNAVSGKVLGARTALTAVNMYAGGVYPGMYIGIASEQKVGKSTFVLEFYVTSLLELNPDIDFEFNILSTEMSRTSLEAKMVSRYIFKKHRIALSVDEITGRKLNPDGSKVKLSTERANMIKKVIQEYIHPISGEFDEGGNLLYKGKINWLDRQNPTGVKRQLVKYAENNGKVITTPIEYTDENGVTRNLDRVVGYTPNNSNKIVVNVIDHRMWR